MPPDSVKLQKAGSSCYRQKFVYHSKEGSPARAGKVMLAGMLQNILKRSHRLPLICIWRGLQWQWWEGKLAKATFKAAKPFMLGLNWSDQMPAALPNSEASSCRWQPHCIQTQVLTSHQTPSKGELQKIPKDSPGSSSALHLRPGYSKGLTTHYNMLL